MQLDLAASEPLTSQLMGIPGGKAGVIATLKIMRHLVRQYKTALPIRMLALDLVAGLGQKDYAGELYALHRYVRDNIRYVRDVRGVETLATPLVTMQTGQGDCDDKSVLLAALLESLSHPTRFVAVGSAPDEYNHVFVESRLGPHWISAETTEPVDIGWQPERVASRLIINN